ncbi:hypothetical protein [Acuticoccus sp.]|uniref:hypothetical protein n=1 Tax=Acuticoccus sp. TaxID=1904378 RepID=UPI003B518A9C
MQGTLAATLAAIDHFSAPSPVELDRLVAGSTLAHDRADDRPGNWHGGIALIDRLAPPRVRAEADCAVLHWPRDLLDDLAGENAHLGIAMLRGVRGGATMRHAHTTSEA